MKKGLLIFTTIIICNNLFSQNKIFKKVNYYYGFGSFEPSYTPLTNDTLKKSDQEIKGIPKEWNNLLISKVIVDYNQYYLQEFRNGKLSLDKKLEMINAGWKFNEKNLLNFDSRCFFYVVSGTTKDGITKVLVDTDNNFDFKDEVEIVPLSINTDTSTLCRTIISVKVDKNSNGSSERVDIPFLVVNSNGVLNYCFPIYSIFNLELNGKEYTFKSAHRYFVNGTFSNLQTRLNNLQRLYYHDDIIIIDNIGYKSSGLDFTTNTFYLEEIKDLKNLESPSIGFIRPGFKEIDLNGNNFDIKAIKNKFIFIDFWATWCSPCVAELPKLKSLYEQVDKNKIVFIGIAVDQKKDLLQAFLIKNPITWRILISNKIADLYRVNALPSNFLIDINGEIIKTNIDTDDLKAFFKVNSIIH
jgi:thiol-disulfide isomerase/thioredoxin